MHTQTHSRPKRFLSRCRIQLKLTIRSSVLKSLAKAILPGFILLFSFLSSPAHAAGVAVPNAGTILQQAQPVTPQTPSPNETGLTIEQPNGGTLPPSAPFEVKTIQITGNTLFDTATLHKLVADIEGQSVTLTQLNQAITRITNFYHDKGYPLARAIIPAQTIQDGVVRIEIVEARYGRVSLDNQSRVNTPLLASTLSTLQSGQPIAQASMDHALLLLSDIPGVVVNATLKPGQTVGTSDLAVDASTGATVSGNLALDNYGNRFTGRDRAGATINFLNPLHHGDYLSLNGLTSGTDLNYGRVAYDTLLNGQGTRIGGSYSALHYILGDTLADINGHGTAQTGSLWLKQPLLRTRDVNLYGQLQYDHLQLRDHIDVVNIQTDRHLGNWTANLTGDARDTRLSTDAVTTWNLGVTSGQVDFDNPAALSADAAGARTQGRFLKWDLSLTRLQSLSQQNAVYLSFTGQKANGNLDSSQQLPVGGPYSVRAYDTSVISGDTGYVLTAEFRRNLGAVQQGQLQGVAFVDGAHLTVNQNPFVAGTNTATLTGAGVGISWAGPKLWSARTYVAAPIGSRPELVGPTSSVRAWLEVDKGF